MNVKLFTHKDDLDGISCAILGKMAYQYIDIEYCTYDDVNEKIQFFIESKNTEYDKIYITDLNVNENTAEMIDKNISDKVCLLDHHKSHIHLNQYEWANVIVESNGIKQCGASLFYKHLLETDNDLKQYNSLDKFVELIRLYDTYDWVETNNLKAKGLSDILRFVPRSEFISTYFIRLTNDKSYFEFDKSHETALYYFSLYEEKYIKKKLDETLISQDVFGNTVGYVFCDEDYRSIVGNKICENFNVDYACIINRYRCSLRSIGDFDVSKIAMEYGGGGHKNAASFKCDNLYKFLSVPD